jgi:hypothetical protein
MPTPNREPYGRATVNGVRIPLSRQRSPSDPAAAAVICLAVAAIALVFAWAVLCSAVAQ